MKVIVITGRDILVDVGCSAIHLGGKEEVRELMFYLSNALFEIRALERKEG